MNGSDVIHGFFKKNQQERVSKLAILNENVKKGEILFTGSSLMEQFPIEELLMTNNMDFTIYNRSVGGFTTTDMMEHMEEMVFGTEPSKIFINIGSNDIGAMDYSRETLLRNYEMILQQIKVRLPDSKVYVMAYYPVNEVDKVPEGDWGKYLFVNRTNENITAVNNDVEELARKMGYQFINVNEGLVDELGKLKKEFTVEGIHMYANAYRIILKNMMQYISE